MGETDLTGTIYIEGVEYKGLTISSFELDPDKSEQYIRNSVNRTIRILDPVTYECTIKFDPYSWYKAVGLWDWVRSNCPNRRVAHLMKYGKNRRIRHKNFRRGLHEICCILEEAEENKA